MSYTLYLVHYPLNGVLDTYIPKAPDLSWHAIAVFTLRAALLLAAVLIFYLAFEANTPILRTYLKRRLRLSRDRAYGASKGKAPHSGGGSTRPRSNQETVVRCRQLVRRTFVPSELQKKKAPRDEPRGQVLGSIACRRTTPTPLTYAASFKIVPALDAVKATNPEAAKELSARPMHCGAEQKREGPRRPSDWRSQQV